MQVLRTTAVSVGVPFVLLGLSAGPVAAQAVPFHGQAIGQDVSVTFEATGIHIVAEARGTDDLINFAGTATITAADGSELFLRIVRIGILGLPTARR